LALFLGAVAWAAPVALADDGPPPGAFGYDISYPQCPNRVPAGPVGFGIIGVNGGRPMTQNSCMPAQLAWARQGSVPPAVYINSSSPPEDFGATACAGDAVCNAYEFGWYSALYAMDYVNRHDSSVTRYWLDVETANTWSTVASENASVLRGMIAALESRGKYVGIYSNSNQFTRIAGNFTPGLDNWIPRPEARRETAAQYCRTTPRFGGGRLVMLQLWYTFDENYVCPPPGSLPPPPPTVLKAGDFALVAADGTCLNLRSGPGVEFVPPLECMPEGTKVSVTGTPLLSGEFYWVPLSTPSGKSGWAAADYLELTESPPPPSLPNRIVVVNVAGG